MLTIQKFTLRFILFQVVFMGTLFALNRKDPNYETKFQIARILDKIERGIQQQNMDLITSVMVIDSLGDKPYVKYSKEFITTVRLKVFK